MGVRRFRGLKRDGPALAIAPKVLTRRLLRRGARYSKNIFSPVIWTPNPTFEDSAQR